VEENVDEMSEIASAQAHLNGGEVRVVPEHAAALLWSPKLVKVNFPTRDSRCSSPGATGVSWFYSIEEETMEGKRAQYVLVKREDARRQVV